MRPIACALVLSILCASHIHYIETESDSQCCCYTCVVRATWHGEREEKGERAHFFSPLGSTGLAPAYGARSLTPVCQGAAAFDGERVQWREVLRIEVCSCVENTAALRALSAVCAARGCAGQLATASRMQSARAFRSARRRAAIRRKIGELRKPQLESARLER